ncbi:hypothetical protein L1987_81395 [Smallanthus sonchifolius]|uniref:Uncharacterized protein n=1 Tax=Smallanthus sonchifolius TaxID=185202 RepID=A0ACB8YQR8_9ASTR|nr:hypothetical protein L1987_81395 [Smallanthus sonchifolius]
MTRYSDALATLYMTVRKIRRDGCDETDMDMHRVGELKINGDAVRGLQPKISIWTGGNGGREGSDGGAMK